MRFQPIFCGVQTCLVLNGSEVLGYAPYWLLAAVWSKIAVRVALDALRWMRLLNSAARLGQGSFQHRARVCYFTFAKGPYGGDLFSRLKLGGRAGR